MADLKIKELFLGNSNAFIVASENEVAVIDGGLGDRSEKILAQARSMVKNFTGIKYALVTHAHYDHVGSIFSLKSKFGATVVAQEKEAHKLRIGLSPVPPGTMWLSRQISWLGCIIFNHCIKFRGFESDLVFAESIRLPFGSQTIECFHTPGHTDGSMCVKIGEYLFAGDTFFHLFPETIFPPFAEDVPELFRSWEKVIRCGAKKVFPGHGKPFSSRLIKHCMIKKGCISPAE